jgi:transposase-like protein
MTDYGLSPQQLAVICALSSGATMTGATNEAGIHRNTVNNWRRNLIPFQQALASAQYDKAMLFREKLEGLVDLALQTIRDILTDPKASSSVRLKAALAIINTAATPPAPKKQIELDIEKVAVAHAPKLHNNAQSGNCVPTPSSSPADSSPDTQPVHNSAQPIAPRTVPPKIGRNEPCPCQSGLKYKRCCLNKPQAAAA